MPTYDASKYAVGHEARAAAHVEDGPPGRTVLSHRAGEQVVAHLVAVLVVLAPDVELLFDGGHALVVVEAERLERRRGELFAFPCRPGDRASAVAVVDERPEADQARQSGETLQRGHPTPGRCRDEPDGHDQAHEPARPLENLRLHGTSGDRTVPNQYGAADVGS